MRACWIIASSSEYGTRSRSASMLPVASPFNSVFSSSCDSVSGWSPVSLIVAGGAPGAGSFAPALGMRMMFASDMVYFFI